MIVCFKSRVAVISLQIWRMEQNAEVRKGEGKRASTLTCNRLGSNNSRLSASKIERNRSDYDERHVIQPRAVPRETSCTRTKVALKPWSRISKQERLKDRLP